MDALTQRANALYWDSDTSVNDIAAGLDLSKGSLYAMIEPERAGLACPDCGAELEYPNRTARDKGFVTCAHCGLEEEAAVVRALADQLDADHLHPHPRTDADGRRALWATALLGVAAAIAVARWIRR